MSRSRAPLVRRPSLVLVPVLAVAASLAVPPIVVADSFGGGGAVPTAGTTRGFAIVTATPSGSSSAVAVTAETRGCSTGGPKVVRASEGAVTTGGVGPLVGARTVRPQIGARRGRTRISVALRPGAHGPYSGTVTLAGSLPRGRRGSTRCRASLPVEVRPRSVVPAPTASAVPRYGLIRQSTTVSSGVGRQSGGILLHPDVPALGGTPRTVTAYWVGRERCTTRGRRPTSPVGYAVVTARLRADGSFRAVHRQNDRRGSRRYRSSSLLTGRIGPDGAVRGSVRVRERFERRGYYPVVCRTPTTKYVASP